jgi:trehalose 6-phosphate phosphatase
VQSSLDLRREFEATGVARVAPAKVLLVTDFDGTLSQVVSNPKDAELNRTSAAALRRLGRALGHVAVLSSRSQADLEGHVSVDGVDLIGDSGLADMTADERRRLDMFNVEASRVMADVPGVWLETKPGGTAIHHRHAAIDAGEVLRMIGPTARETRLLVHAGRRVVEVMPRDHPKGEAIAALIERLDPAGVVCIGDDENDRPMFERVGALAVPHLTVGVASDEARPDLFADCDLVLSGPDEVGELLTALADWASSADRDPRDH